MPYVKFHDPWENEPSTDTPITAEALDHIEAGIQDAHDTLDNLSADAADINVTPAVGGGDDVQEVLTTHESRLDAVEAATATIQGNPWMVVFSPQAAESPTANFPTLDLRNAHPVLDFDAGTDEATHFTGILPTGYEGGGINVKLIWAATSATSGNVIWEVSIERIEAGNMDIDADSFATAVTASAAADSTSGDTIHTTLAFSNGAAMDSMAAGEMFRLKVSRDANNGSDNMAGDAELLKVVITEQ